MSSLIRGAWRSRLLCVGKRSLGLSWSRRCAYLRNLNMLKYYITARQLTISCRLYSSDNSRSWTQVDLEKVMEKELEDRKGQRITVNVKELFGENELSNKKSTYITSQSDDIAINMTDRFTENRQLHSQKHDFSGTKDFKVKGSQSGKKGVSKRQNNTMKVVNFSYPKVEIPANFSTVNIKDFNFPKFVEEFSSDESGGEETDEKMSRNGFVFGSTADELLNRERYLSKEEWEAAEKRLTDDDQEMIKFPEKLKKHLPLRFMLHYSGCLINPKKFEVINSLWDYAQDFYDGKPPPLLMAAYMNVLASQARENKVLELYEELNERTKGIPEISVYSQVVSALLCTSKYKDCQVLTAKMEKFYHNMRSMQDCWFLVAYAHLLHGDPDEYRKVMDKLIQRGYDPTDSKVAVHVLMKMNFESGLKFLQNCRENLWLPGIEMTNAILSLLERDNQHAWTVTPTEINARGQCRHCGTSLAEAKGLMPDSFKTLQSEAMAALLDGKDIYLKSNPAERRAFLSFCEKHGPFDVVVDGLNLFYARTQHGKRNIQEVITTIKLKYPAKTNVLVVLRRHLMRSFGIRMEKGSPAKLFQAFLFPLRDESEDDPYLLMAALSSGAECMVVSNDDYADQSYAFGSNLRPLFLAWQRTNQIFFTKETGSINLQWPKEFEHSVQEHSNGIHLPFSLSQSLAAKVRPPNSWLCCLKEPKS